MMPGKGTAPHPPPHGHFVQFYKADEPMLNRNVGRFLWEGFLRGHGLLVIAARRRWECLCRHLGRNGMDVDLALAEERLAFHDAQEMLALFMVDGQPVWERFRSAMAKVLAPVPLRGAGAEKSVYGEMVGILWEAGQLEAAIRLEDYWNALLLEGGITLFCGYPIDVFDTQFHTPEARAVLCSHSSLVPTGPNGDVDGSLRQAMEDLLGPKAGELRLAMEASLADDAGSMPPAEGAILWLRSHLPEQAESILARARGHYAASHQDELTAA